MPIKEVKFSDVQEEFLNRGRQLGVVLDICILEFTEAENSFEILQLAAIEAMKIFANRYLERLISFNPGRDVSGYFQIRIDERVKPKGQQINYKEFLGTGFDFNNNCVNLFSYSKNSKSSQVFDGLVHALLDPPYGIGLMPSGSQLSVENGIEEQRRMTEFLSEFLDKVLNIQDFTDFRDYEIYSWSDDWSNYFEAGKEWWGTFYWTLLDSQNQRVIVIGASTTD